MSTGLARRGKHDLIFDVDGSQFLPGGLPCSLCGAHQEIGDNPRHFVRVREKIQGRSVHVAHLCPDCIARAIIQAERHNLWRQLSGPVAAAIKRTLSRRSKLAISK